MTDFLTSEDVAARYRLNDPGAARRIMREAGAVKVGRRLLLDRDRLDEFERDRTVGGEAPHTAPGGVVRRPRDLANLTPGWWR